MRIPFKSATDFTDLHPDEIVSHLTGQADFLTLITQMTQRFWPNYVYSTNLSCKASFAESFVIVHEVNGVDFRLFSRYMPKQIYTIWLA
ncbi:MAG: hypothetical protein JW947_09505 [Sedimentisphaerales bacterium]|nr:hypothetical protein [Sedimentisphaerales bacterium]